jgi:superfamily II DNA or RNA helicase
VRKLGGDYNEADLSEVMGRRELLGNIVGQWKANAGGVRTVVFAVDVAHSQHLCERFREVGVAAEHVDAQTPKTEREAILARLASGATTVVCNVAVLTEGWDCPAVECIIMARPTQSLALHLQMAGRGLRPNEATGKKLCRIHDHAGNIITHGLPDAERDYSLTTDRKANKKASEEQATTLRTCEECFAIYRADLKGCPACGHVNKTKERKPQETDEAVAIPLSEIAKYDAKYKRPWVAERSARSFYDQLMQVVRDRGYKERWAAMRFKEKFGFFPRYSWRDDAIRNSGS